MKKYLSSLNSIEEGLSTTPPLFSSLNIVKHASSSQINSWTQGNPNQIPGGLVQNEMKQSPGIDTKPFGIYSPIKVAFQISTRVVGSINTAVLPSAAHTSGTHAAIQNGHFNSDGFLSGHDKTRECSWIRFQISGFLNWFEPILVTRFSSDYWEEMDLLGSMNPQDNSVGAIPALPLTLALETLWKSTCSPCLPPHLPSAALTSYLPCQFFFSSFLFGSIDLLFPLKLCLLSS